MSIQPGRLNAALELQALTASVDDYGAASQSWATVGSIWAEMWTVRGDERAMAASTGATLTHRARMWAYPGLTTDQHRFKLGSRSFDIKFINDVEMKGVEYVVDLLEIVGREAQ